MIVLKPKVTKQAGPSVASDACLCYDWRFSVDDVAWLLHHFVGYPMEQHPNSPIFDKIVGGVQSTRPLPPRPPPYNATVLIYNGHVFLSQVLIHSLKIITLKTSPQRQRFPVPTSDPPLPPPLPPITTTFLKPNKTSARGWPLCHPWTAGFWHCRE